jgi:hypothetical protein
MSALNIENIDNLTLCVPAEGIDLIGIGAHSADEDTSELVDSLNPQRTKATEDMLQLWDRFTTNLKSHVTNIGVCDLETDIFFKLFHQAEIKPANIQVIFSQKENIFSK